MISIESQLRILKIIFVIVMVIWAYAAIEPFLYILFDIGFIYDYDPNFKR